MPQRVSLFFMNPTRGFSLIELMIVVVVVTTAVSITVPKMSERDATYRMEIATQRVHEDIEEARRTARFESRGMSMTFDPVVASYYTWAGQPTATVPVDPGPNGGVALEVLYSQDAADTTVDRVVSVSGTTRVALTATDEVVARQIYLGGHPFKSELLASDFNSAPTLTFDGFGTPVDGGSVFLAVRNHGREIAVDPTSGRVSTRKLTPSEIATMKGSLETAQQLDPGRDWEDLLLPGMDTAAGDASGMGGGGNSETMGVQGGGK